MSDFIFNVQGVRKQNKITLMAACVRFTSGRFFFYVLACVGLHLGLVYNLYPLID